MTVALVLALAGCSPTDGGPPPRVDGLWEVFGRAVEGPCRWERATFTFGETTVVSSVDVLCSGDGGQHAGCTARAVSPAAFDAATSQWIVERPIAVRVEATPAAAPEGAEPSDLAASVCAATLEAGPYAFSKVRGEDWKWKLTLPSGTSVRLRRPNSSHPEFVTGLRADPPAAPPAEAPADTASVWGPFRVHTVTENGTTEDFRKKMERASTALDRSCAVTDAVYDFRSPTGEAPPTTLAYTEIRACEQGGLGPFRNALTATVPVEWVTNEGGTLLVVPPITAEAGLVRIHADEEGGRLPAQWIADELVVAREGTTFLVATSAPKGKKPGPPATIQLTAVHGKALHLVPVP